MRFCIQASHPKTTKTFDSDDETLGECVETVFPLDTEMALMNWLGVFVPLNYKYSISTILSDILEMLDAVLEKEQGKFEVVWPSSDFNGRWSLFWESDNLVIEANWESVIGDTEILLNSRGPVKMGKSAFLNEWKALLEVVLSGLLDCGYDESVIADISKLKMIYSRIERYGVLYGDKRY